MLATYSETDVGSTLPRIGPQAVPDRHLADVALQFTAMLGFDDPLPWQHHAMACITELSEDRDRTGARKFATIENAVVVARQNGKTDLAERRIVLALFMGKIVLHTAHHLGLPMETFLKLSEMFEEMVPPSVYKIYKRVGHETIKVFTGAETGVYTLKAPKRTGSTMRGGSSDLIVIDEYLEYADDELVAAAKPRMLTRPSPQILYLSNAGGIEAVPLRGLRERGVTGDSDPCWMEWSAPDDAALDDHDAELSANPAWGYFLNTELMHADRRTMTEAQYRKEHLCQFLQASGETAYPMDPWRAGALDDHPERSGAFIVAVDTDPLRRVAAAVTVYQHADLFHVRTERAWSADPTVDGSALNDKEIADDVVTLCHDVGTGTVLLDPYTCAGLAEQIGERLNVVKATRQNIITAGAATFDLISGGLVTHPTDDAILDAHIAASTRKPTTDGGWRISRKGADPIPAAVAATLALWQASLPRPVSEIGF